MIVMNSVPFRAVTHIPIASSTSIQSSQSLMYSNPSPIDIVFHDLVYSKITKHEQSTFCRPIKYHKHILNGVSGIIKHGKVTAIMGASGAGKTTLLNILAQRVKPTRDFYLSGQVLANMQPYAYENFGDFASYIMQADLLMETLTVRELLQFAAALKINGTVQQRNHIINRLISELKLEGCIDVRVGNTFAKGISGGEKKRTAIAFELIGDPQVVFLDEPTSGLDSLTAYVVVSYMKKLAEDAGKTIVMTIHQPGTEIYDLFDTLILMVAGRIVYQGPAASAVNYFSVMGFNCPTYSNPSDYFMQITHLESKKNQENFPIFVRQYQRTQAPKIMQAIQSSERGYLPRRTIQISFCSALGTLLWRDCLNTVRNPVLLHSRIAASFIFVLMTGAVFWKLDNDYSPSHAEKSLSTRCSVMFMLGIIFFFPFMTAAIVTFPAEKPIYLKESSSKMYSLSWYFLSRNIVELPVIVLVPIISSLIIYWMAGFHTGVSYFFVFVLVGFLTCLCGNSFGLFGGSIFNSVQLASSIIPSFVIPLLFLGGFLKNRADFSSWYGWLEYLSPFKYAFSALSLNEFRGTAAPVALFNFNTSLTLAIILLAAMSVALRLTSLAVLMIKKDTLQ